MMVWHGIEWNGIYSQRKSSDSIYIFNAFIKFILTTRVWAFSFGFSVLGVRFISSHSSSSDIYAHKIIIMTIGQFIEMMNSHLLFEGVRAFVCVCVFYPPTLLCSWFGVDKWWKPFSSFLNFISIQLGIYTINELTNQPNKQTNEPTQPKKNDVQAMNRCVPVCITLKFMSTNKVRTNDFLFLLSQFFYYFDLLQYTRARALTHTQYSWTIFQTWAALT